MNSLVFIVVILAFVFPLAQLQHIKDDLESDNQANRIRANSGCACEDQCEESSGTYNVSCDATSAVYFSCKQSTCTVKFCPNDQIFNEESMSCEFCPSGLKPKSMDRHVYCGCPLGTQYRMGEDGDDQCIPCTPKEPVTVEDCQCYGLVLDQRTKECRKCPDNTLTGINYCRCIDARMVWSPPEFSCIDCPGILVEKEDRRSWESKYDCECAGEGIFNWWTATCNNCPSNSVYEDHGGVYKTCQCLEEGKYYNPRPNACV